MPPKKRPSISTFQAPQCFVTQLPMYVAQYRRAAFLRPLRGERRREAVGCDIIRALFTRGASRGTHTRSASEPMKVPKTMLLPKPAMKSLPISPVL